MDRRVKVIIGCVLLCAALAGLFFVKNSPAAQPIPFGFWKKSGAGGDPCAGKSIGQAGDGTTAVCAGSYNGFKYMTTPADAGTMSWSGEQVMTGATSPTDGAANTADLASRGATYAPAYYCDNLDEGGYQDWFLPASGELKNVLYNNRCAIGNFCSNCPGFPCYGGVFYWSSVQFNQYAAITVSFSNGSEPWKNKLFGSPARCVRKYS